MNTNNDYSKFSCFVKGVLVTAEVIQKSDKQLVHQAKMYFNQCLAACKNFEKYIHRELGPELAADEDEINSSIVGLVWNLYEMTPDEREQFIDYINEFEYKPKQENDKDREQHTNS
jgi:hypothetical protein